MAYRLLSLAISETRPGVGEFNVIALEMSKFDIIPISLRKENIITSSGEIVWDLGRVTIAEDIERDPFSLGKNTVYKANDCHLSDEAVNLRSLLDEYSTVDIEDYFGNSAERFAIVKVRVVDKILLSPDKTSFFKSRLVVYIQGIAEPKNLLNKDYRWVNYWHWQTQQKNSDQIRTDMLRYANLLNRNDKKLYLILYKHHFEKDNRHEIWIAGMHWL